MSGYRPCIECKRPMRAGKAKAADHPGTVQHSAHGQCAGCYKRRLYADGAPPRKPRPHVDETATERALTAYLEWRRPYRAAQARGGRRWVSRAITNGRKVSVDWTRERTIKWY